LVIHTLNISNQQWKNDTDRGNPFYSEKNLCHFPFVTRTGPELIPALCSKKVATNRWSCAVRSNTQQYVLNIAAQFGAWYRLCLWRFVTFWCMLSRTLVQNDVYAEFGNV